MLGYHCKERQIFGSLVHQRVLFPHRIVVHLTRQHYLFYAFDDMLKYINNTVDAIYGIEHSLLRRQPAMKRWQNWHMAHADNWYYAYSIDGDIITIHDACHQQNIHD